MASPNIEFYDIGSSIRKPGKYFEFNTRLAVRTLPGNQQTVLMLAQMLDTGTAEPLQAVSVFSDDEAAMLFGRGSMAHMMAVEAIGSNSYLQLQIIGISDDSAAVAATGTFTVTGAATTAGTLSVWIGSTRVDVAVSADDTAADIALALAAAIAQKAVLPVTATAAAGVVTLTAKNKGAAGNDIQLRASTTAVGVTVAATAMTGGEIDPDIALALAAVFAAGHNIIVSPFATSDALRTLRTHLDKASGPMEQRGAIGVAGWPKSLSTGTTMTASINSGRITVGWHNGSVKTPAQIAAAYAAIIASEEDPARPLNTLAMSTLDVTALADRPGRNEQESALYNGLTPFEVGPGDAVQIVRAISTYTKNADGVDDVSLLDITTIRTLDYVRKACRERISLRFPRDKLSSRTPDRVRSELLDVLYKLEELEIIEEVDANKAALIIERDSQDSNRLNGRIPADVVNGLHIFAGRIDLLL
ncbi:phage tail sheath subtilisin-like domain-containing protein [Pectobacterium cacticida]|uniref:Phage tail sheath C-terminal domain-containing protein n=1 Tax=Pectobacterium cacticida TaxID=69221 RepID=A0ABZ2GFB4_9GAMM|nr:phage tail sheath subtilisin-like domain-containing protein [Pectobacterium cacticida]UYX06113.1 phage tail sheath subtilisin-like domain-containing protein [Pectobacterium cacticida]